jgi:hypothetical protein
VVVVPQGADTPLPPTHWVNVMQTPRMTTSASIIFRLFGQIVLYNLCYAQNNGLIVYTGPARCILANKNHFYLIAEIYI